MSCFFFYKIGEQKSRTGPVLEWGYQWEGEEVIKGCGRVNIM
jgi:hypothetical protein